MNADKRLVLGLLLFLLLPFSLGSKPPKHFDRPVYFHNNVIANYLASNNVTTNNFSASNSATISGSLNVSGPIINNGVPIPTGLAGDVTGPFSNTQVNRVGGQPAADIASATIAANDATPANIANTIVLRDGSGNFTANMIRIDGAVTYSNDVATKIYCDNMVTTGFIVKTPALVMSNDNEMLSGLFTIDGVLLSPNDRVLLIGQTNAVENGLWLSQISDWTRPTDFASSTSAGNSYVLTYSGITYAGASWICSTPAAVIDVDPISFTQFALPDPTTGENVGTGPGKFFRNKTGKILNFKTLASGAHLNIANNPDDVTLTTDATSLNVPNAIMARDASGIFAGSGMHFTNGANYVGLNAPATIPANYSVNLPSYPPTAGQVLQATSASTTTWAPMSASPAAAKTFYVSLAGSDSNDGSLLLPYRTVAHAVFVANMQASLANPISINVGAGIFVEDNTGGPITITADGICIQGSSAQNTTIMPMSTSKGLFLMMTSNVELSNMALMSPVFGAGAAVTLQAGVIGSARFNSLMVSLFQTGFSVSGSGGVSGVLFDYVGCAGNGTNISINNVLTIVKNSVFQGAVQFGQPPSYNCIEINGGLAQVLVQSCAFNAFNNGVVATNGSIVRLLANDFENNVNNIVCTGGSKCSIDGCNFLLNLPSSINISAADASTEINIAGCSFKCTDSFGIPRGTALQVTHQASIYANSCSIIGANFGLQCGVPGDTVITVAKASSVSLINCIHDIEQLGTSALYFVGGSFEASKVSINDPTNVSFAAFDSNGQAILSIGNATDNTHPIYRIENGQVPLLSPNLTYNPNYYGYKGTIYQNPNTEPTVNATQSFSNNVAYDLVTGDRTKTAALNLFSDAGNFGINDFVRGWSMAKQGGQADLSFTYSNNDSSGLATRGANAVMNLNGFDNKVEFPLAANSPLPTNNTAKLVWAGDTNLYRSAANILKTDNNLAVGTLATQGVVHNDATGLLSTSLIVNNDISGSAGITDDKLATISTSGKVANSATTATNANEPSTIVSRDLEGNFSAGRITANVTGNATTADSATNFSGELSGEVTGTQGNTVVAFVDGKPAADVSQATSDVMAATSNNVANMLVKRDGTGIFSGSSMRFDNGSGYVGLSAPATVPASYSVSLPSYAPVAGQVLKATSVSTTTWGPQSPSPLATKSYYVSLAGSDSNDGSLLAPFRTVSKAIQVANTVSTANNPVAINIGAGVFMENNTGGPLTITADGISLLGSSIASTNILPMRNSNDLFSITTPNVEVADIVMTTTTLFGPSTKSAINHTTSSFGRTRYRNVAIGLFNTGFNISASGTRPTILMEDIQTIGNAIAIQLNDAQALIQSSVFRGSLIGGTPINTAVVLSGPSAQVLISDTALVYTDTAVQATNGAFAMLTGCLIQDVNNGIIASGAAKGNVVGCLFSRNRSSSINVSVLQVGTNVYLSGCMFDCADYSGVSQGTALSATQDGILTADSCSISHAALAIQCGDVGDTGLTFVRGISVAMTDCTADINQVGSAKLHFVGGTYEASKISIADPVNVSFAAFDSNGEAILAIGNATDSTHQVLRIENGETLPPTLTYNPNYYGCKGLVYLNPNPGAAFNATQAQSDEAAYFCVTGDRSKASTINLASDTGSIGLGQYERGWRLAKEGGRADLSFTYSNNDIFDYDQRLNTVMNLNGYSNQIEFPATTNPTNSTAKLAWAGDTYLYRGAANTLKTDNNLVVGGLATPGVVHNDATGLLSTSLIVNADVSGAAGITDDKLATIVTPGKVSNSATSGATTKTANTLALRDSNADVWFHTVNADAAFITNITGSLSGNATSATSANTAANFSGSLNGEVSGLQNFTHVNSVGGQSATNIGLATAAANAATSDNTGTAIVKRDNDGNFSAGTITANQFNGPLSGNVTGDLSGNATSATTALTANSATTFTGLLNGDVTGLQGTTHVSLVGGQNAADVAAATSAVLTATSNDVANKIVIRDGAGDFSANNIRINGEIINPMDAATKEYVDAAVSSGFVVKDSVLAISITDVALSGLTTIDGVVLHDNDRVLLIGQADPIENGLWLAESGDWERPIDFAVGTIAGAAYVLTTSGNTQVGSSWVCTSTAAIIGTDPIVFTQFSMAGQMTGANVGDGAGKIFRDKTGQTLNFKTLAAGLHIAITNNTNDVTLATDATSDNTPSTIIQRDDSGDFSAGIMYGSASNNVLKAGDTMSGNLTMAAQSAVRFADTTGNYVGWRAPSAVPSNYTIDLPPAPPSAGYCLQATSATTTTWMEMEASPAAAKTYYVSLAGDDSNDGTFLSPFRTIRHAISVANSVASLENPIAIKIGIGNFVENNAGGPLTVTADGISIIGTSMQGTNIIPADGSQDLFRVTSSYFSMSDLELFPVDVSTANAINQATAENGQVNYNNIALFYFQTGFRISASGQSPTVCFNNIQAIQNGTAFESDNAALVMNGCTLLGAMVGDPANNGMILTGVNGLVQVFTCVFYKFNTAVSITGGGAYSFDSCMFEQIVNSIIFAGATKSKLSSITFAHNYASSINLSASDPNTKVYALACTFDGQDYEGNPHGVAVQVTTGAELLMDSSSITMNVVGIQTGTTGDTGSTYLRALSIGLSQCTTDIIQTGSSTLQFIGGTCNEEKVFIENPINVNFAAFHSNGQSILSIGPGSDSQYNLLQVVNGQPALPHLHYTPNYYGYKGVAYQNENNNPTFNATEANLNNAAYDVVTRDRTKSSTINLLSDAGGLHDGTNMRGWEISKQGDRADLSITFSNNDTSGYDARLNTVMNLNGYSNQIEFPATTNPTNSTAKLAWAGDTNLYRSAANTLKTDTNLVVGGLTSAGVVHNNAAGLLSSSLIVNADVSGAAGITDDKLATIATLGKVANSATSATPTNTPSSIVLRDAQGDFAARMITANLTGNVTGNVSGHAGSADSATTAANFSGLLNGEVTGPQGTTVVSSIKALTAQTIVDDCNRAAEATNLNTFGKIVCRDGITGGFSAGTITATLNGNATSATTANSATNFTGELLGDVTGYQSTTSVANVGGQNSADVGAATVLAKAATSANTINQIVKRDASGGFNAGMITANLTGVVTGTATYFNGALFGDVTGLQSTTSVAKVGGQTSADVGAATVLTKAATSANTANQIVKRDGSGNFSAGTITAILNGTATSFTGLLSGQVTGSQNSTVVSYVGNKSAADVVSAIDIVNNATPTNTPDRIVVRDSSGDFAARMITANVTGNVTGNLSGNATSATSATTAVNFSGSLNGEVTGPQGTTVVSSIKGLIAQTIVDDCNRAAEATNLNTFGKIVCRDGSGNFNAGEITASLNGNATSATTASSAANFTGALLGDVTGYQSTTSVTRVGGLLASTIVDDCNRAAEATNLNTFGKIVCRDGSGNFNAGEITASLNGNATSATTASSAANFTGALLGDVTGLQSTTSVAKVGGQTSADVGAATVLTKAATSANTANQIVKRDGSGNFNAGMITANLTGVVTGTATYFNGALFGDVTGLQSTTSVAKVGGQTSADVGAATVLTKAATDANTSYAIVRRNSSGNFSAGTITATLTGAASLNVLKAGDTMTGNLTLPAPGTLYFGGSGNTGVGAAADGSLLASTNGTMTIQKTGANSGSIAISSSGTTNIVSNTVDCLDVINTAVTTNVPLVLANLFINQAAQVVVPTTGGSVNVNSTTSILVCRPAASVTNYTIVFPASRTNGQYLTILDASIFSIGLLYNGNGASVVNTLTTLNPSSWSSSVGGTMIAYYYLASTNTWYRAARG